MPPAKPALQREPSTIRKPERADRQPTVEGDRVGSRPLAPVIRVVPPAQPQKQGAFQPRVPVITGEATYRGTIPVNGIISGQMGATGSALTIKQRPKNGVVDSSPELDGELTFKDMLRINGHVAGRVTSVKGTLIIDASARVDADIDVSVCVISGIVNGDVTARERVELGAGATIYGNIVTRSITMKPGAVFHGDCRMLKSDESDK